MLKNHFSKICMITIRGREKRADTALTRMLDQGLVARKDDVEIVHGVYGEELPAPAWWRAGNGAWGCLMSHTRVVQDAWQGQYKNVLILEDDVLWTPDAANKLNNIMPSLPQVWGQLYLGGQHRREPEPVSEHWMIGRSINRTHAYALNRSTMPLFLRHIWHAPDYIKARENRHIDHQLEAAHRRGDWNTLTPRYWLAGQGENTSSISGKRLRAHWWDWCDVNGEPNMPYVVLPDDYKYNPSETPLHEGYNKIAIRHICESLCPNALQHAMRKVWQEAFNLRRLPALRAGTDDQMALREKHWPAGLIYVDKLTPERITEFLAPERFTFKSSSTASTQTE